MRQILSRILNEELDGSKVSYLSSVFYVVELVTMLLDALITKERYLKKMVEAIIPILQVHSMIVKILEVSWHVKTRMLHPIIAKILKISWHMKRRMQKLKK